MAFGLVGVEWAEHGSFGAVRWFRVVDAVNEQGETEDVGEEDELLQDEGISAG